MPMSDSEKVEFETGSKISIRRPFIFRNRKYRPWVEICGRNVKIEIRNLLSLRCRGSRLQEWILSHAAVGSIWTKPVRQMQYDCVCRSMLDMHIENFRTGPIHASKTANINFKN